RRTPAARAPFASPLDRLDPIVGCSGRARAGAAALLAAASFLLFSGQAPAQTLAKAQPHDPAEFFEKNIRPVLVSRCYSCHTNLQSGGLRLDSRQNILKGGKDGAVVVAGHPEDSVLIKAISHTHERLKMPLGGPKLDDETIENFRKWVKDGVAWPESPEEF